MTVVVIGVGTVVVSVDVIIDVSVVFVSGGCVCGCVWFCLWWRVWLCVWLSSCLRLRWWL